MYMYVENVDSVFDRAVKAGAKADMPPQDMFWGDRYGKLTDPFGHQWALATHTRTLLRRKWTSVPKRSWHRWRKALGKAVNLSALMREERCGIRTAQESSP